MITLVGHSELSVSDVIGCGRLCRFFRSFCAGGGVLSCSIADSVSGQIFLLRFARGQLRNFGPSQILSQIRLVFLWFLLCVRVL